jgi:HEAT repeat protein
LAQSLDELLSALLSGDESRSEAAVGGLVEIAETATAALLALRQSTESDHRWWAVRVLAAMEHTQTEWFVPALADPAPDVRGAAALALAAHPDGAAIAPLVSLLSDEDNVAAVMAVHALAKIGSEAVPQLVEAFEGAPRRGQIQIVRALAELRDARAIRLMLNAQAQDSAALQYWAQQGLERLGLNMVYLKPD